MEEGHDITGNNTRIASHTELLAAGSRSLQMSTLHYSSPLSMAFFTTPLQCLAVAS